MQYWSYVEYIKCILLMYILGTTCNQNNYQKQYEMKHNLTISSGKQQFIICIYSESVEPSSAWISCTFFKPPDVTNSLLALASWGKIYVKEITNS